MQETNTSVQPSEMEKKESLLSYILSALNVNAKGSENLQQLGRSGQMEVFKLVTS